MAIVHLWRFFCVIKCFSRFALPQHIAITGSIDQFGLVHSVGGVNDKIEGFLLFANVVV